MLNGRSLERLDRVHPDLVRVIKTAATLSDIQFIVTEGVRTVDRQKKLYEAGASKTMKSRHIPECNGCGFACAVDLAAVIDGDVRWDWPLYSRLADFVKRAAKIEEIEVEWGGDWKFKDGPHFQLPWGRYP